MHACGHINIKLQTSNPKCQRVVMFVALAGTHIDLMESFFLSETVKYLYLIFSDADHLIDYYVLSTEGHLMPTFDTLMERVNCLNTRGSNVRKAQHQTREGGKADKEQDSSSHSSSSNAPADSPASDDSKSNSQYPPNCQRVCEPLSMKAGLTIEQKLRTQFPLVAFDPKDAARIRRRRCRACIAVAEHMQETPAGTDAVRTARLNFGQIGVSDVGDNVAALEQSAGGNKAILSQVLCSLEIRKGGAVKCGGVRMLSAVDTNRGLPPNSVILQLSQVQKVATQQYAVLVAADQGLDGEAGPRVLHYEAAHATFGPQVPLVSQQCLKSMLVPKLRFRQQPLCPAKGLYRPNLAGPGYHPVGITPTLQACKQTSQKQGAASSISWEGLLNSLGLWQGESVKGGGAQAQHDETYQSGTAAECTGFNAAQPKQSTWLPDAVFYDQRHPCMGVQNLAVGPLVMSNPPSGCTPPKNAAFIKDSIAVVFRGECSFMTKVLHMQKAGALGVIVLNMYGDELLVMSTDSVGYQTHVPVLIMGRSAGKELLYWMVRQPLLVTLISHNPSDEAQEKGHHRRNAGGGKHAGVEQQGGRIKGTLKQMAAPKMQPPSQTASGVSEEEQQQYKQQQQHKQDKKQQQQQQQQGTQQQQSPQQQQQQQQRGAGHHLKPAGNTRVDLLVPIQSQAWLMEHVFNKGVDTEAVFNQVLGDTAALGMLVRSLAVAGGVPKIIPTNGDPQAHVHGGSGGSHQQQQGQAGGGGGRG